MRTLLAIALVCVPLSASAHDIEGFWEGKITCGEIQHPIRLDLTKSGGTIDLPDRFVAGERIADVHTTPVTLKFSFRDAHFTATVERGRIAGSVNGRPFEVVRRPRTPLPYRIVDGKLSLSNGKDLGLLTLRGNLAQFRKENEVLLLVRLPQPKQQCSWLGPEHAGEWIDRVIRWSLAPPKKATGSALYDEAGRAARLGDADKALALLDRAIEEGFDDPALIESDQDLADLHELSGFESIVHKSRMLESTDAVPRLEQAHIEYPHSGRAAFNLGLGLQKSGDLAEAGTAFTEAAGLRYKPIVSAYNAAVSFGRSGDRAQMLRWLDRALQLGFPVQRLLTDAEFASLRDDPEVKTLITRYGTNWPD